MDEADLELIKDWLTRAHQDLRGASILAAAEDARPCSAGFQTCCVADFQVGRVSALPDALRV